jgi:uncharacterized membrane protein HdeD (DUF308 family)
MAFAFIFLTRWIRWLLQFILDHNLFFIMGIIEILIGLGTLYYRHVSNLKWFSYFIGLMLFIDGIFYLLSSSRFRQAFEWFLYTERKIIRSYGIVLIFIALGYCLCGI